jgi:hypothetical protein
VVLPAFSNATFVFLSPAPHYYRYLCHVFILAVLNVTVVSLCNVIVFVSTVGCSLPTFLNFVQLLVTFTNIPQLFSNFLHSSATLSAACNPPNFFFLSPCLSLQRGAKGSFVSYLL